MTDLLELGWEWFENDAAPRAVVGRDLTILAVNEAARDLLAQCGHVAVKDEHLRATELRDMGSLSRLVGSAGQTSQTTILGAPGKEQVLVEARQLNHRADGPVGLVFRPLGDEVDINCADLDPVFGVTSTEQRVLLELLKGRSSREIADGDGRSVLTVRTHVKRAYYKIHVSSREQLFARLLPYLTIRQPPVRQGDHPGR